MSKITHEEALKNINQFLCNPVISFSAESIIKQYISQQQDFEVKVKRYLELGFPIYEDEAIEYRNFKNELKEMVGLK
jgi:hypothetical protein